MKRSRNELPMPKKCMLALAELEYCRDLARDHCLTVECNEFRPNRFTLGLHIRFMSHDGGVLHYWPQSGSTWEPRTNRKRTVRDIYEAMDIAAEVDVKRKGYVQCN